jgi:alpha-tubulin N-acetyltransferase 1
LGKEIFDFMLNYKKINPGELAYDRPTLRFLAFLKRNYGLENYIQQENNFTIYDEFFESERNKNNETQYDSDTHRVIQNLYTPRYLNRSVDFNSNNKYITNINPNYNNNNYRNSPQNNQRNMNIKKNYYLTETDNYQRTSMSPIGKQLIYNNDMIDNKRNNYQKYYNYNQRMNQYNERNNDIRYNITNRYNEDNQNQIYNKRYNNEDFNYDNRNQEYDYNQQNNNNQRLQNTINKGRFSPNQMSKSMQAYENNYNNNQNNYGGRRRLKYDYDDY